MSVTQLDFVRAVLDPGLSAPEGLVTPQGRPAAERFNIYRNNVVVSLIEALGVTFPVLVKLLGDNFFNAMADAFVRKYPPDSPVLMLYGQKMPAFLETFEPVQQYPYLADVARLEIALVQSYHAVDAIPVDPRELESLSPESLLGSVLRLSPSVRLLRSPWPVFQLWRFNTKPDSPKPQAAAEDVLVVRPEFDPIPRCLPQGGGAFIETILQGRSLDEASSHFDEKDVVTSLAMLFGILIQGNAITAIE